MRTARVRYDEGPCCYHAMNRVAGEPGYLPFGEAEKEMFFRLAGKLTRFYRIDLLSLVVMGNHWHAVCVTYPGLPSLSEMRERFKAYYGPKRAEPNWANRSVRRRVGKRMRDLSMFFKDLQQSFSNWFNETRPQGRQGRLWAGRYKSVILEGESALWECLKYVEMNPVRAGLCADPSEYRFGTLGRLLASGQHPFGGALVEQLRDHLGESAAEYSDERVIAEFCADIARVAAAERGEPSDAILAAEKAARMTVPTRLRITRRVRYWTDGAIIGSKRFVLNMTAAVFGQARVKTKRLGTTETGDGTVLFTFRRVRDSI